MPGFSGTFSGRARVQTAVSLSDTPGHELQLVEIAGAQQSKDENWKNAKITYWGFQDLTAGTGTQRGYYVNERKSGERDCGTFEGKVTIAQGQTTTEGTFHSTDRTGKFKGVKAQGTYKGRMVSPTEVEMTWEGKYELAAAKAA